MASQNGHQPIDITNPFEIWRTFRDVNIEAWAQGTAAIVNTEAFSQTLGLYLDHYLVFAAPFQEAFEKYQDAALARFNLPSRTALISLAQRMTNMEMRLDDMEARIDQIVSMLTTAVPSTVPLPVQPDQPHSRNGRTAEATSVAAWETRLQTLDEKTGQLLRLLETLQMNPPAFPHADHTAENNTESSPLLTD